MRDKKTGKSKGFCFLCYEDQRSTVLAVDNFNGIKVKLGSAFYDTRGHGFHLGMKLGEKSHSRRDRVVLAVSERWYKVAFIISTTFYIALRRIHKE